MIVGAPAMIVRGRNATSGGGAGSGEGGGRKGGGQTGGGKKGGGNGFIGGGGSGEGEGLGGEGSGGDGEGAGDDGRGGGGDGGGTDGADGCGSQDILSSGKKAPPHLPPALSAMTLAPAHAEASYFRLEDQPLLGPRLRYIPVSGMETSESRAPPVHSPVHLY